MKKSKAEKLTTEEIEGIKKLLQLRYGLEGTAKYPEFKSYLKTSHRIKDTMLPNGSMTRLLYEGEKLYNVSDNDELNLWRDFLSNERDYLLNQIPYANLYQNSYSINIDSAKELIAATNNAKKCIYFNTQLSLKDWFHPVIQLHLSIQKSIEQRINFKPMKQCFEESEKSFCCNIRKPTYRQYRILIIPLTTEELNKELRENINFKNNLYSLYAIHTSLSMQLSIISLNHLIDHLNNLKSKIDFSELGLSEDLKNMIGNNKCNINDTCTKLKQDLIDQNKSTTKYSKKLDYLCIENENGSKDFWGAVKTDSGELIYNAIDYSSKREYFTSEFFDAITENYFQNEIPLFELDTIHPFLDQTTKIFKNNYHAGKILNIE